MENTLKETFARSGIECTRLDTLALVMIINKANDVWPVLKPHLEDSSRQFDYSIHSFLRLSALPSGVLTTAGFTDQQISLMAKTVTCIKWQRAMLI